MRAMRNLRLLLGTSLSIMIRLGSSNHPGAATDVKSTRIGALLFPLTRNMVWVCSRAKIDLRITEKLFRN
jgi:hypothetical protein